MQLNFTTDVRAVSCIESFSTQEGGAECLQRLSEGEVHIWVTSIDHSFEGILFASELVRCKKMKSSLARKQFEVARKTLRYLVSCYLTLPQEEIIFEVGAHGKPFVLGCPEFFFNIAHSKDFIVLAFSRHSIGVDLELIRPVNEIALASRFFDPGELALLKALPQEEREQRFFQLWTAKEAALKADGRGIANGLKRAVSHSEKESVSSIHLDRKDWCINFWNFSKNNQHFLGAIATPFVPIVIRWHNITTKK